MIECAVTSRRIVRDRTVVSEVCDAAPIDVAKYHRFQWEPAQDCHVLLFPEGMVKLPGSGGEIFKRIDGARSLNAIVAALE